MRPSPRRQTTAEPPKKILYLSSAGEVAGSEVALLQFLRTMGRKRFDPFVICCQTGKFPDRLRQAGIPHEIIPFVFARGQLARPETVFRNLRSMLTLRKRLNDPNYDLVETNDALVLKFLLPVLLLCGKPLLYQLRNYEWKRLWMIKLLFRKHRSRAVVVSQALRDHYRNVVGIPERSMTVIHPGINPDVMRAGKRPGGLRRELGLSRADRLVGLIARFDLWKGHFTFLKAAERIIRTNPNVHFVIVGETMNPETFPAVVEYQEKVLQFASRPSLAPQVHFLGWRDDIPKILSSLDVAVCPSENEPFAISMLEALSAGVPFIGSDSGGTPEVIEHGKNGLLFPTGDDGALAECILRLLRNPVLARWLAAKGRTTVQRHFTMKQYVHSIETLYERMTA